MYQYHLAQSTWHLEIQVSGAGTWHLAHHQNLASGVCLKRAYKMQFSVSSLDSLGTPAFLTKVAERDSSSYNPYTGFRFCGNVRRHLSIQKAVMPLIE